MSSPMVSIVLPAYNHDRYVEQALLSALAQTWPTVEVVAVDDGSTDGTWDVLSKWKSEPRVALFRQHNQGAHAAINRGMAEARGEYLAILNSDDIYPAERLALLMDKAESMDGPVFLFTDLEFIQADGTPLLRSHERRKCYEEMLGRARGMDPEDAFLAGNPAMTSSNFFMSRSAWEAVGPFRSLRYNHDWDWALRACGRVGMAWVDEVGLSYRVHTDSTLAEGDAWRHISENAFLFASHLKRSGVGGSDDATATMDRFCSILLGNQSFLPTAVLLFLLLMQQGTPEEALEAELAKNLPQRFAELYGHSGLCSECLLSAVHLDEKLTRQPLGQALDRLRRACGLKV